MIFTTAELSHKVVLVIFLKWGSIQNPAVVLLDDGDGDSGCVCNSKTSWPLAHYTGPIAPQTEVQNTQNEVQKNRKQEQQQKPGRGLWLNTDVAFELKAKGQIQRKPLVT